MIRRLLRATAQLVLHHPRAVLVAAVLPMLVLGWFAWRTPIDLSFAGIMDRSNPEVARYFDTSHRFQLGGSLIVLLEGDEAALDQATRTLEEGLADHPAVRLVVPPVPEDWLAAQAPWLVDRETFDLWVHQIQTPLDIASGRRLAERFAELAAVRARQHPPGARLVEVKMWQDPFDEVVGGGSFFAVESAVTKLLEGSSVRGVRASFSGMPAVAAQDQARTLGTVRRLSPLSLGLVLVVFCFVERRFMGILGALVPMLLAVVGTLGAIGLLTGSLTVMETFFGVTVFGLGIDFAVHLLVRQREERAKGLGLDEALVATLAGTGRGVLAGALTTAGAFFIVALAPDPVAVHLGLPGGIGLSLCLLLMITMLPAAWVLMERRRSSNGAPPAPVTVLPVPWIARLARHAVTHPWWHLGAAAAVLAVALLGLPRFRIETEINKVFNRDVPAVETVERVRELFGINGAPWIVPADSLEQAARIAAELRALPNFEHVTSIADVVPVPGIELDERRAILAAVAPQAQSTIALAQGLLSRGLQGGALPSEQAELVRGLETAAVTLANANRDGPPTLESAPAALRERLVSASGESLVLAYVAGSTFDARQAREDRLAAQSVDPRATSLSAILEAVLIASRPWVVPVALGVLGFVVLVLYADFRKPRLIILALVPVALGVGVTFGVLCWLDVPFNVMTTLVVPLIVGLGVDDGIHVVHRLVEDIDETVDHAAAAVGRAITLTTATTCLSFGVLLLTDHPGLETMGLVMLIGMPVCLLASVTTLPALAVVMGGGGGTRRWKASEYTTGYSRRFARPTLAGLRRLSPPEENR